MSKGFYPTREGLYSNQGEVTVSTDEGVVYTLRYGEVFIASGLELSAGVEDDEGGGKDKGKDAEEGGGVDREPLPVRHRPGSTRR